MNLLKSCSSVVASFLFPPAGPHFVDLSYRSPTWAGEGIGRPGIGFLRCGGLVKSSPFKWADLLPCWEPLTLLGSFVSKSGNYRGTDSGFSWHFSTLVRAYLTRLNLAPFLLFHPSAFSRLLRPLLPSTLPISLQS